MLKLAGRLADGTITWMTGPVTLNELTAPTINQAAADADRPTPQVISAVPVCITDDIAGAEASAAANFGFYGDLPSYRAMLDREGFEKSQDIALIGSFDKVAEGLQKYADAGATTVVASIFGTPEDTARSTEELAQLL
jgi:alkanesulfonate monooxygenase SsuD/methylene tetrahydromethanopterin reductase-like flavin-dependent oxidoreductase (luciferase family)